MIGTVLVLVENDWYCIGTLLIYDLYCIITRARLTEVLSKLVDSKIS